VHNRIGHRFQRRLDVPVWLERGPQEAAPIPFSFSQQIAAGADDVFAKTDGFFSAVVQPTCCDDGGGILAEGGFRYDGVAIPVGATIFTARLHIIAKFNAAGGVAEAKFQCANEDDSAAFVSNADFYGRPLTAAQVNWSMPDMVTGIGYDTPDLTTIIQEVVDRVGWAQGNAMNFFWLDNGSGAGIKRFAEHFETNPLGTAELFVTGEA